MFMETRESNGSSKVRATPPRSGLGYGRFMQADPAGYEDGPNLYGYVQGDPVNRTDPTGKYVCEGSRDQCRAVSATLARIAEATQSRNLSRSQRAELQRALRTYGREGQRNGVVVGFASPAAISRVTTGAAYTDYNRSTRESRIVLPSDFRTLYNNFARDMARIGHDPSRLARFSPRDERGNVLAHEGRHAFDQQRLGRQLTPQEAHPVAYHTGALVNRAFGSIPVEDFNNDD